MKKQYNHLILSGLGYLRKEQEPDGRFRGRANDEPTETIFFTALIALCLQNVPNGLAIGYRASVFLCGQRGEQGAWNYWGSKSKHSSLRHYPDDLDDSALALATILHYQPEAVDGGQLAKFAEALVSCEISPGGPYSTWLTDSRQAAWCDVDVVVNANIGYLTQGIGITPPGIVELISEKLKNNDLTSRYYVGKAPVLYFIAKSASVIERSRLQQRIIQELKVANTPLVQALLITAACHAGIKHMVPASLVNKLCAAAQHGVWPAEPLYYEPPKHGVQYCAASPALTTAFAVEALYLWSTSHKPVATKQLHEVKDAATIVAQAGGWDIPVSTLRALNRASTLGWRTYQVYDDIIDGDLSVEVLPAMNIAMRKLQLSYQATLPNNKPFQQYANKAMQVMDLANQWELEFARDVSKPPDYRSLRFIAEKSWGHTIALVGVMLAASYQLDDPEVSNLLRFYKHYITARQLCDDARDWPKDLARGQITPVVAIMLDRPSIEKVNARIRRYIAAARQELVKATFLKDTSEFEAWLKRLNNSLSGARDKEFIDTFYS